MNPEPVSGPCGKKGKAQPTSIRLLITLIALFSAIHGCGGGAGTDTVANGGIGGTGITTTPAPGIAEGGIGGTGISTGPITGFGSIYSNGIKYDVESAEFYRDGTQVFGQDKFSIGELVTIEGNYSETDQNGTARKVIYNSTLIGPVTTETTDGVSLKILHQNISTDKTTVLIGRNQLTEFTLDALVEVTAYENSQGDLIASSLKYLNPQFIDGTSSLKLTGAIQTIDTDVQELMIKGITIDYANAIFEGLNKEALAVSDSLTISSLQPLQNGKMVASRISRNNTSVLPLTNGEEIEIEGLISSLPDTESLYLGNQRVALAADTQYEGITAGNLKLDDKIKVTGKLDTTGTVIAQEISLRESKASIEIEGAITAIDYSTLQFEVLGASIIASNSTILLDDSNDDYEQIKFSDLIAGTKVAVKGHYISDGLILATRIDRENVSDEKEESELELEGEPENISAENQTFSLFGLTVQVTENTKIEIDDISDPDAQTFFNIISDNKNLQLKVSGTQSGTTLLADKIEIESD